MKNNRIENVYFKLKFNKASVEQFTEEIKQLTQGRTYSNMRVGDMLYIDYIFFVEYLGNCEKSLSAILTLLKNGISLDVNTEELKYGTCLIQDVFLKLEEIRKELKHSVKTGENAG